MSTAERAAALARKTKGTAAVATTAITNGSYHHAAAAPFPIGHGHGAAAATTPSVGFGTAAATSSQAGFGTAACSQAGFGAAAAASTLPGFGKATTDSPPIYGRSFTGDSNHARGGLSGASPVWWDATDSGSPISPAFRRPTSWDRDNNSHPPGGFIDILNNQANFHLVGAPSLHTPFKAPRSADVGGSFASMDASLPSDVEILSDKQPAVVDRDSENVRTEKRIMWTPKENEILMGAWIENSTDSTTGVDRKGEAYWGDVIKTYNKNTPSQRRSAKQAKDRWHKINRWCHTTRTPHRKGEGVQSKPRINGTRLIGGVTSLNVNI